MTCRASQGAAEGSFVAQKSKGARCRGILLHVSVLWGAAGLPTAPLQEGVTPAEHQLETGGACSSPCAKSQLGQPREGLIPLLAGFL